MDPFVQVPYAPNLTILTPVCFAMFTGRGPAAVFQGAVEYAWALELLVGGLRLSILAGSAAGLVFPRCFAPLLAMQVFYKLTWLVAFLAPAASGRAPLPVGVARASRPSL